MDRTKRFTLAALLGGLMAGIGSKAFARGGRHGFGAGPLDPAQMNERVERFRPISGKSSPSSPRTQPRTSRRCASRRARRGARRSSCSLRPISIARQSSSLEQFI